MPHFDYCSSVWHFSGVCSTEKIDTLNNGILRFILQDYNSLYDSLLSKFNSKSLYKRCLQTLIIMLYKSLFFTCYPGYLRKMFCLPSVPYSLHRNYVLSLPSTKSTTYGLHSFLLVASKLWNSLPDSFRMSEEEYIFLTTQCSHCFLPSHPDCQVMQGLLKIQLFQNLFIGNTVKNNSISESYMEIFERSSL